MTPLVSILVALGIAVALIVGARLYFDRVERRKAELRIGMEVLASRSWKDGLDLLAKALLPEGGTSETLVNDKGVPLPERLLSAGGKRTLLVYKHGTTYRIGPAVLAEAQRRREEVGADDLCIATIGTLEPAGVAQAGRDGIRLVDGAALWSLVEAHVDDRVRQDVGREALESLRRPRTLATAAAALVGAAIVLTNLPHESPASAASTGATPATTTRPGTAVSEPAAIAEETPDPARQEARRAALVASLIDLRGVEAAQWSSNTTVVIDLLPGHGVDGVFAAACGLTAEYPELRDIRLQLESEDPAEGVRWRRCG